MTEPTRQEVIDAHNALAALVCFGQVHSVGPEEEEWIKIKGKEVATILPPRPRPTMAEIEWDDDIHYLAEAEHPDYGKVIMLFKNRLDWISCFYQERSALFSEDPSLLTPTGRRYTLTEVQE